MRVVVNDANILIDLVAFNPRLGLPREEVERRMILWGEGE
jgi:hypothetical protein